MFNKAIFLEDITSAFALPHDLYCMRQVKRLDDINKNKYEICWFSKKSKEGVICLTRNLTKTNSMLTFIISNELIKQLAKNDCGSFEQWEDYWKNENRAKDITNEINENITSTLNNTIFNMIGAEIQDISFLSSMTYEGNIAKGKIVFFKKQSSIVEEMLDVSFDIHKKVVFDGKNKGALKCIRKFLEGCGERALVFCKETDDKPFEMKGYMGIDKVETLSVYFTIQINGIHKWEFSCGNGNKIYIDYMQPIGARADPQKIAIELAEKFNCDNNLLLNFFAILIKQSHGTSVVLYRGKNIERRLSTLYENNRAVKVNIPLKKVDSNSILAMSRLDGAFMVDMNDQQRISAFGVILDGKASSSTSIKKKETTMGRGARYNTLVNFYNEYSQDKTSSIAILIISEDGDINYL